MNMQSFNPPQLTVVKQAFLQDLKTNSNNNFFLTLRLGSLSLLDLLTPISN